jgi:hypothetical protein
MNGVFLMADLRLSMRFVRSPGSYDFTCTKKCSFSAPDGWSESFFSTWFMSTSGITYLKISNKPVKKITSSPFVPFGITNFIPCSSGSSRVIHFGVAIPSLKEKWRIESAWMRMYPCFSFLLLYTRSCLRIFDISKNEYKNNASTSAGINMRICIPFAYDTSRRKIPIPTSTNPTRERGHL